MENFKYEKLTPYSLKKSTQFDEKWLQTKIQESPEILGLGNLTFIQKERPQSSGGRLDLYLRDYDNNVAYEVELMLGKLDESHIIRTIEYWDLEKERILALNMLRLLPQRNYKQILQCNKSFNKIDTNNCYSAKCFFI